MYTELQLQSQYRQFIADVMAIYECQEAIQPLQEGFDALNESLGKTVATAALAASALAGHGHAADAGTHAHLDKAGSKPYTMTQDVHRAVHEKFDNYAFRIQDNFQGEYENALMSTAHRLQKQLTDMGTPEALGHAESIQKVIGTMFPMSFTKASETTWEDFTRNLRKAVDSAKEYISGHKGQNVSSAGSQGHGDEWESQLVDKANILKSRLAGSNDDTAKKLAVDIQEALDIGFPVKFTDEHADEKWQKMIPELTRAVAAASSYVER